MTKDRYGHYCPDRCAQCTYKIWLDIHVRNCEKWKFMSLKCKQGEHKKLFSKAASSTSVSFASSAIRSEPLTPDCINKTFHMPKPAISLYVPLQPYVSPHILPHECQTVFIHSCYAAMPPSCPRKSLRAKQAKTMRGADVMRSERLGSKVIVSPTHLFLNDLHFASLQGTGSFL